MSKYKNKIDPNVKKILEESNAQDKLDPNELPEGEYVICPGCGEKMPKTIYTCVTCGAQLKQKVYTPISDQKAAKIRWITGAILLVVFFVVWLFILN